jgi:hypothetical protein
LEEDTNNINQKINEAVDAYFESNSDTDYFPAKKLMPVLIKSGVFFRDKKSGLPLRLVLRALDTAGELGNIPRVHAERIGLDVYWYFVREGAAFVSNHITDAPNAKQKRSIERANSDEVYIMGLIDGLLNETGSRKHTFDYLLGDLHKNNETRTELPIDLYYANLNLAVEITEHPDKKKNIPASKEEKSTVSGMTRAEQRLKYKNRKKVILTKKDKVFIEIPLKDFDVNASMKLLRDKGNDERVLRGLLSDFIH